MYLEIILSIMLLIISVMLIKEKNNLYIVIFFSVFSLVAASLYFYNAAPDVALAELSIGSAFIPLIFIITISKQKTFTVVADKESLYFCAPQDDKDQPGVCYMLLDEFCQHYDLKLKLIQPDIHENQTILGAFRSWSIDLIVKYESDSNRYYFIGKTTSLMMSRLDKMTEKYSNITVVKVRDYETED